MEKPELLMRSVDRLSAQALGIRGRGAAVLVVGAAFGVLLAAPVSTAATCDEAARASVLVRVNGVRSSQGFVEAVLYGDQPEDFLKKGKRLARQRVAARPGQVVLCLPAPGPGVYAVAVYHDENGDTKLGRSWLGLPTEGYGLSNNPPPVWRWPQHADSAFRLPGDRVVLDVDLRYGIDGSSASRPEDGPGAAATIGASSAG
jgi:uncharacterized protein (DUF2141 family)